MRVLLVVALAACAPATPTGSCLLWSDCGEGGACEYSHVHVDDMQRADCSFADSACETGRRFGEFASPEVANDCVPFSGGFDGLCDDAHACGDGFTCQLGRCINVVQLDGTAQVTTGRCSDRNRSGGDVYVWGIAFLSESPALFKPDSVVADAVPLSAPQYPDAEARAATIGANHLCLVGDGGFSECFGRIDNPAIGFSGAIGTWARTNPLGSHSALAAGVVHSCGASGRSVDCWGLNADHQLDGDLASSGPSYDEVTVDIGQDVTHVTAGKAFTCAGTPTDVWCWGDPASWNTTTFDGPKGSKARVLLTDPGPVTGLDAGEAHACAIMDTQLWCWGTDDAGQVDGVPSTTAVSPSKPLGDTPVRSVATGKQHTCAVTADDTVMCWGSNVVGQLGIETGSSEPRVVPLPGRPTGALSATDFTTCVVLEDSWIHCFGAAELTTDVPLTTVGGDTITLAQFFACTL
jgi:hypothetical protein